MRKTRYDDILLISDLDGTIVPLYGTISDENKAAINNFTSAGGAFAIATGRTPMSALPYMDGIHLNTPSIFLNGAMLKDTLSDTVLNINTLDGEIWRNFAARVLYQFPRACVEVYTETNCYILSPEENDDPRLLEEFYEIEHTSLTAIEDNIWLKFFVNDAPINLTFVEQLAREIGINHCSNSFYSDTYYLEFVAPNTSKGAMTTLLRKLPSLDGRQVIACGDYENDVEMLHIADIGIAPADASESARNAANHIGVASNEPLIAWILKEIL